MAKILVIDDDPVVRSVIRQMLAPDGHVVIEASDGVEGLKVAETEQPALVICDIIMPKKEGIETIISLSRQWPGLPVIAISGSSGKRSEYYLSMAEKLGASASLVKPFSAEVIRRAVKRLLPAEGAMG